MNFPGLPINPAEMLADVHSLAVMTLLGRHKFDRAMVMLVVVAIHKYWYPFAGFALAGKGPAGVIRPVFDRTEHGFRINVIDENLCLKKNFSTTSSSIRTSRAATRNSSRSLRLVHCHCQHGESVAACVA